MNTNTKLNGWNAIVHLPASYAANPAKVYPVIYFFPGTGEVGTDINKLLTYGPNAFIKAGWDGVINGREYIIISIQPTGLYPRPWTVKPAIDAAEVAYRIDKTKVCLTGLSMGGWVSNIFATYKPTATDFSYLDRVKVVMNVQGVVADDGYDATPAYPSRFIDFAKRGGKELCLEQALDGRGMETLTNTMNAAVPGSSEYYKTSFGSGGHCCFQEVYGGNYKINGKNVYAWIDEKLFGAAPANVAPVVSAGADQQITRPVNEAVLSGTCSDIDGVITSKAWTVISGSGTFDNAANGTTTVRALSLGDNVFRLTVTDDKGASSIDDVKITVAPAPRVLTQTVSLYSDGTFETK